MYFYKRAANIVLARYSKKKWQWKFLQRRKRELVVTFSELCFYWSRTQAMVEKCHPNKVVVNRSINLFSDNVIDHFRKIMKSPHYQTTLEK